MSLGDASTAQGDDGGGAADATAVALVCANCIRYGVWLFSH